MKKIVRLCALLMALALFVSGCSMVKVTKTQDPATVLAEFTGGQVLLSDAQAEYDEVVAYYSANGYELNDEEAIRSIKDEIVHYLVENKVIENKARELGLYELSEEEKKSLTEAAEKEYEEALEYYMVYFQSDEEGQDPEAVRAEVAVYLAENGYTKEMAVELALSDAWQNKLNEYVTADVAASEDQINAAYEELVAADQGSFEVDPYNFEYAAMSGNDLYWYPEGYRAVKHILIPFTDEQVETLSELTYKLDDVLYQLEDLDAMENGEDATEEGLDLEAFGLEEGAYADGDYEVAIEPLEEGSQDFDLDLEADGETVEEELVEEAGTMDVLMEPEDAPDEEHHEEDMPSREELEKEKARLTKEVEALKAEYLASVQPTVDEVLGKIAAGEDFEALIEQYGQDPGMQEEPTKTLGYFVAQGSEMWERVFTETAMKLEKPGDVSEPVVGTNGVHIIKFMRALTPGPVPLDDVRDACTDTAQENSKTAAYDEAVETWVAEANVTFYHDRWN